MEDCPSDDAVNADIPLTPPLLPYRHPNTVTAANLVALPPRCVVKPAVSNQLVVSDNNHVTQLFSDAMVTGSTSPKHQQKQQPTTAAIDRVSTTRPILSDSVNDSSSQDSTSVADRVKVTRNDVNINGCSRVACNDNQNHCRLDETHPSRCHRAADNIYVTLPSSHPSSVSPASLVQNLGVDHLRQVSSSYSASTSALLSQSLTSPATKPSTQPKSSKTSEVTLGARERQQLQPHQAPFKLEHTSDVCVTSRPQRYIDDNERIDRSGWIDVSAPKNGGLGVFASFRSCSTVVKSHEGTESTKSSSKRDQFPTPTSSSLAVADIDETVNDVLENRHGVVCSRCGRCRCDRCGGRSSHRAPGGPLPSVWCGPRCGLWTVSRTVECISCVCLVQAVDYHCSSMTPEDTECRRKDAYEVFAVGNFDDIESGKKFDDDCDDSFEAMESPCSCVRSSAAERSSCRRRWACLLGLAAVGCLPCLLLYWPLRAIAEVFRRLCGACNKLGRWRSRGCRCRPSTVVVIVVDGSGEATSTGSRKGKH